ncbi:hypothetical protein HDV03_003821 [Kappamyces sp. JEL0829]|nr:hypothetical protein HDV03_003821 [Kappamyces sp. JEL0829]
MIPVAFAYVLAVLHALNGVAIVPVLYACVRRIRSERPLSAIFFGVCILSVVILTIHLIQFCTILINVPGKTTLDVYTDQTHNWDGLVSKAWCTFDALATLFFSLILMFLGVMLTYIPFAIFWTAKNKYYLPFVDWGARKFIPGLFATTVLPPALLVAVLAVVVMSSPIFSAVALSDWHCSVNYKYNAWFEYILAALEVLAGVVTAFFAGYSVAVMQEYRKESLSILGRSEIPEDLIMRSFLLGTSSALFDLLFAVDTILNIASPSIGIYNGVPYILMVLMSTLGSFSMILWGTTQDLLPFMPAFMRPSMRTLQEAMKEMLQLADTDSIKAAASNLSQFEMDSSSRARSPTKQSLYVLQA